MDNKKSYFLMFLIVLFIIVLLSLATFFIFDKTINGDIEEQENRIYGNYVNNSSEDLTEKISILDNIKNKLEDDYFIDFIILHKSLDSIKNQDILKYLISLASSQSQISNDIVSSSILKDLYDDSLLKINYVDENIGSYWEYSRDKLNYTKVSENSHESEITPIFKKLDSYKKDNNKYILSYKYGFVSNNTLLPVYGTYYDAIEKNNNIYGINNNQTKDDIIDYLNTNYQTIKNKMDTYNYVVEVNDNRIKLINFYIS